MCDVASFKNFENSLTNVKVMPTHAPHSRTTTAWLLITSRPTIYVGRWSVVSTVARTTWTV